MVKGSIIQDDLKIIMCLKFFFFFKKSFKQTGKNIKHENYSWRLQNSSLYS